MMCVPPGPEQERGKGEVLGLSWGPFKGDTDASSYKSEGDSFLGVQNDSQITL